MTLYRTTLVDENYEPLAVLCRHSNLSIQDYSDQIHDEIESSPFGPRTFGVAVEIDTRQRVPAFLQEQAL